MKKFGMNPVKIGGGGKAKAAAGLVAAGVAGRLSAGRDKRREKREEKRDKRNAGIEEARLAMANRMPALKSPLLWWIPFILGPIIYAIKTGFRWVFDAVGFVLRPVGTAITYAIQIPAKLFGGFLGAIVTIAVILGFIYLFVITSPGIGVWFMERGIHDVKDFGAWVASVPGNIAEDVRETFRYRMALATGEYWEGEEEGEEVGIFLERVMPLQSKFYPGDPIIVSADLRGSGDFGETDDTVTASCLLVEDDAFAKKIYPSEPIKLRTLSNSKEGFECEFEPLTIIDEPNKEVKVMIEFPFETSGRVTLTFMDEDFIRQLRREDEDPNVIYGIPEMPVSLFQPGPIMVGLGTVRSNPIGAQAGKRILTRLGFTLDNRWEGEIINITDVEIIVDSGISLPEDENTIDMEEGPISLAGGRNKYVVDKEYLERLTGSGDDPITTFTSLNFRMELDSSVLKDTVISHKEVEVKVKYKYKLWKRTQIQLHHELPWRDEEELTEGACGTEFCSDKEVCCENENNPERPRECRLHECPTHWKDVTDEIRPPEDETGAVECSDCAEDEKCCECSSVEMCRSEVGMLSCRSECTPPMYTEVAS